MQNGMFNKDDRKAPFRGKMMMKVGWLWVFILLVLTACEISNDAAQTQKNDSPLRYRAVLTLNDSVELPFIMEYHQGQDLKVYNGGEVIQMLPGKYADSVRYDFPVFNSALVWKEETSGVLRGYFHDFDKGYDLSLAFHAEPSEAPRFKVNHEPCCSLNYPWEVIFRYDSDKPRHALGEFFQKEDKVQGSILTTTGDYRFLEGVIEGENFTLATFDGKFAYVFRATIQNTELVGHYYAGKSEAIPWLARRNDEFSLPSSNSLTFIKDGYESFDFAFPDLKGQTQSIKKGKVNLVQILGSWCPNCMDEARVLEKWYQRFESKGLHVVGLAFEYSADEERGWEAVKKMKSDLSLSYPMVFVGQANAETTAKALPMLNHVMAYPTLIVVDREGNVRQIKTGFKGPGTSHFASFKKEMESLISELLNE
jgi:thiol-disulfide isomerase/thioredoxin